MGSPKKLTWNHTYGEAFFKLKMAFTTASILHHPDPTRPFAVEVDTLESGVGAVLSHFVT